MAFITKPALHGLNKEIKHHIYISILLKIMNEFSHTQFQIVRKANRFIALQVP